MKVLSLINLKGGSGRTTLAISLAVAAAEQGFKVHLIDLDQGQKAVWGWYQRRKHNNLGCNLVKLSMLESTLAQLNLQKCDICIIDTPHQDNEALRKARNVADLCIIPSRPCVMDISLTREVVSEALRLRKEFQLVFVECDHIWLSKPESRLANLENLSQINYYSIGRRVIHADTFCGLGVTEIDTYSKAASEIRGLWQVIASRSNSVKRKTKVKKSEIKTDFSKIFKQLSSTKPIDIN